MPACCPLTACSGDPTDEEARKQHALLAAFEGLKKRWRADPKLSDKTDDQLPWQLLSPGSFTPGFALFVYTESREWPKPHVTHVPLDVGDLAAKLRASKPRNKRPAEGRTSGMTGGAPSSPPKKKGANFERTAGASDATSSNAPPSEAVAGPQPGPTASEVAAKAAEAAAKAAKKAEDAARVAEMMPKVDEHVWVAGSGGWAQGKVLYQVVALPSVVDPRSYLLKDLDDNEELIALESRKPDGTRKPQSGTSRWEPATSEEVEREKQVSSGPETDEDTTGTADGGGCASALIGPFASATLGGAAPVTGGAAGAAAGAAGPPLDAKKVNAMKVDVLRQHLEQRGLPTDGLLKAELQVRLKEALGLLGLPPPVAAPDEETIRSEIDAIVGMADLKTTMKEIIATVHTNSAREARGLPLEKEVTHMLALGNPGTGKTTTCRRLANWLHGLGVLRTGAFVEASRATLVAGYEGQSAIKAEKVMDSARGGILFVDEAQQLVIGREDAFGKESLTTINKYMEDHKKDIIVIMAGYEEKVKALYVHEPGLPSRFSRELRFGDYSADELVLIAPILAKESGGNLLSDCASAALHAICEAIAAAPSTGNARTLRKAIDKACQQRNNRLDAAGGAWDDEQLLTVVAADFDGIVVDEVQKEEVEEVERSENQMRQQLQQALQERQKQML